jgi:AcrR family transcriptional regulator
MGVAERRAREKEALRQSIVDAAGELILADGYESFSIRKLAERIEYSPSTIYLYFKDKAEILATICNEAFGELSARLEEIRSQSSDPLEALGDGLRCYVSWGLAHPNQYMVTFGKPWPPPGEIEETVMMSSVSAGLDCFHRLASAIQRCIDAGSIPSGDTGLMAQIAWTSVHGLTSCLIIMKDDPHFPWAPTGELVDGMARNVVAGLRAGAIGARTIEPGH